MPSARRRSRRTVRPDSARRDRAPPPSSSPRVGRADGVRAFDELTVQLVDPVDQRLVEARVVGGLDHALVGELAAQDHPVEPLRERLGRLEPVARLRERLTRARPGSACRPDGGSRCRRSRRSPAIRCRRARDRSFRGLRHLPAEHPGMPVFGWLIALAALGALAGCVAAWRRWRAEQRELARVRATFARYVAPSVVDHLLARKDERMFTGQAVRATVLVCRIRNFAHFIEPLSPEETLRYLNEFYALAGTAVQRHRGIIEIVPRRRDRRRVRRAAREPDAGRRRAAGRARDRAATSSRCASAGRTSTASALTIGIGINTGEMIAGDAGFRDRREFTVVGSEAMFAHRLQEAAFALNAFIVASRATCETLTPEYKLVPVSGVPLRACAGFSTRSSCAARLRRRRALHRPGRRDGRDDDRAPRSADARSPHRSPYPPRQPRPNHRSRARDRGRHRRRPTRTTCTI